MAASVGASFSTTSARRPTSEAAVGVSRTVCGGRWRQSGRSSRNHEPRATREVKASSWPSVVIETAALQFDRPA